MADGFFAHTEAFKHFTTPSITMLKRLEPCLIDDFAALDRTRHRQGSLYKRYRRVFLFGPGTIAEQVLNSCDHGRNNLLQQLGWKIHRCFSLTM